MMSHQKEISFIGLYYKHARIFTLILLFALFSMQVLPFYLTLNRYTFKETGYIEIEDDFSIDTRTNTMEYETVPTFGELVCSHNFSLIFNLLFAVLIIVIFLIPTFMDKTSNPSFTIDRLGLSKKRMYYLQLLACFLALLSFFMLENMVLVICHGLYQMMVPSNLQVYNGYFQAYVNNEFIKFLCPLFHPSLLLFALTFLFTCSTICVNAAFYLKNGETSTAITHGLWIFLVFMMYSAHVQDGMMLFFYLVVTIIASSGCIHNRAKFNYNYVPISLRQMKPNKTKRRKERLHNEA